MGGNLAAVEGFCEPHHFALKVGVVVVVLYFAVRVRVHVRVLPSSLLCWSFASPAPRAECYDS